jgi:hypothetical protein
LLRVLRNAIKSFQEEFPYLHARWGAERCEGEVREYLVHCCPARIARKIESEWALKLIAYDPKQVYCWKRGVQLGPVYIRAWRLNAINGHNPANR